MTKYLTEWYHRNEYTHYQNLKRREGEKVEENFEEITGKKKKKSQIWENNIGTRNWKISNLKNPESYWDMLYSNCLKLKTKSESWKQNKKLFVIYKGYSIRLSVDFLAET